MAFITFNKAELVNLSYSLKREILCANKTGSCCNTTIVGANTRRYHGLLSVPIENFQEKKHVLLSSIDESIIVDNKQFNLGIHRYGTEYDPKGHKYIIDFNADPYPEIVYKVGDIIFTKTIMLAPDKEQLIIKYELKQSPSKIKLQLKPFLAFRNVHSLTKKNSQADTSYKEEPNGLSFCLYEGFPRLYLQLSNSKYHFIDEGHWYQGITYVDESRRGFDSTEDLWVPGFLEVSLKEGESIMFSASTQQEKGTSLKRTFNDLYKKADKIENYHDQLLHCASTLIRERNGKKQITSGFSWLYTGQFRETLEALPGLTLYASGKKSDFEAILDNLIEDNKERLYLRTTQIEAPLRIADILQQYISYGAKPKKVWDKYGDVVKGIVESYGDNIRSEVNLHPNGLLWAQQYRVALSWMNAYINGVPVTERAGYQVETNAFWYNTLCFSIEMEKKYGSKKSEFIQKWESVRDLVKSNYKDVFWNPRLGFLADYVDNEGQHMEVRPNQMLAIWLPYCPVEDEIAKSVIDIVANELVTKRGIRTLSPRCINYRGVYEGTQTDRDLSYHQGCTRPFLLYYYVDICLRMNGNSFLKKAEWLIEGFYDDLNKHGVGAFAEIYDGDPPHEPHGAISSALSTSSLLGVDYLINKYREAKS